MKILVTGAAGFIGCEVSLRLLELGNNVVGLDNVNDYYSQELKYARLNRIGIEKSKIKENEFVEGIAGFKFIKLDLENTSKMELLFKNEKFDIVINLAAQAGVRYSIDNPNAYIQSNIIGFLNVLEGCRNNQIKHLVYASSSSVYGKNRVAPFSEDHGVDHPVSLYAATKKSNELMAHSYSNLFGIPTTGLRFFTVYGPWGRPDMAPILFADKIMNDGEIKVFNNGKMERDFTYIDDIVEGVVRVLNKIPKANDNYKETPSDSWAPYQVINIGNGAPMNLMTFIETMELAFGKKVKKQFLPMQEGDVPITWADTTLLKDLIGEIKTTSVEEGVKKFAEWFIGYNQNPNQ